MIANLRHPVHPELTTKPILFTAEDAQVTAYSAFKLEESKASNSFLLVN